MERSVVTTLASAHSIAGAIPTAERRMTIVFGVMEKVLVRCDGLSRNRLDQLGFALDLRPHLPSRQCQASWIKRIRFGRIEADLHGNRNTQLFCLLVIKTYGAAALAPGNGGA